MFLLENVYHCVCAVYDCILYEWEWLYEWMAEFGLGLGPTEMDGKEILLLV